MSARYLTVEQVVRLHEQLMVEERQQSVLIAPEKLESAVMRPQSTAFGEDAYPDLAEKPHPCSNRSRRATRFWTETRESHSLPWVFSSGSTE